MPFTSIFANKNAYILEGTGTARTGDTVLRVEAGDFIDYPAGAEAHDLHNTGSNILKCIIVGQRLDFDIVDYPE
ncbi:MAG: cupin domain-containing protein [Candidatus Puniceispirillaceae bacterium]